MKKKIFTFLTALMLFLTGFFIKKSSEKIDISKVIDISKPKEKLEEFLSNIKKESNQIIVNNEII